MSGNDLVIACGCRFNRKSHAMHYCKRHRYGCYLPRVLATMSRDLSVTWNGGGWVGALPFTAEEMGIA